LRAAVLIAGAALIAGCGSGSSPSGTSTTQRGATTGSAATSSTASGGGTASSAAVELATCGSTAARSRLSRSGKARFLTLCKQAVNSADPSVKRDAAEQCQQIIKQTVPAAAQPALIAGCPKS